MNRVAIAFSSKDRVELTKRTIEPLLQPDKFDLHWIDGSKTDEGRQLLSEYDGQYHMAHHEVIGGSCRAIVYALTEMLKYGVGDGTRYEYVGLVENDVLLDKDWLEPTMSLFERGRKDGFEVGTVSARTYEDRVLIQRDGYAVMHNIGAGCQIFTRKAAEIILQQYRTGMTSENRRTFSLLSGVDIGGFWAFRGSDHMIVADWCWDQQLAKYGMCSLALTPAKAEQLEDVAAMGLEMVREPIEARRDERTFETFRDRTKAVRNGELHVQRLDHDHLYHDGTHTIFPHQIPQIGGSYSGDWRFKWSIGYGCFSWQAGRYAEWKEAQFATDENYAPCVLKVPVLGPCDLLVSGGTNGGKVHVTDGSGFEATPELCPEGEQGQVLGLTMPAAYNYREIEMTALTSGVIFYGVRARMVQPTVPAKFDFSVLPPL